MTPLEQSFTAWADREFGPAPNPAIPQTVRFASYWKCWQAAQPQRTGNAIRDAFESMCAESAGINSPHNACMHRHYCRALESKAQGRTIYLSDPEMKDVRDELMRRIREEPGFGRGLMQDAGIIDASGKLAPLYGGEE